MARNIVTFLFIVVCFTSAQCFTTKPLKVLAVFPMTSPSHYILGFRFVKELALKGHSVTLIAPYMEKKPVHRLKTVFLEGFQEKAEELNSHLRPDQITTIFNIFLPHAFSLVVANETLAHKNVQNLLKSDADFDVVIIEQFLVESLSALCHKYSAVCIKFASFGASYWTNWLLGNPQNPLYIADFSASSVQPYGFFGRIRALAYHAFELLIHHLYFIPQHDKLIQENFPGYPSAYELNVNPDMIFYNSHPTVTQSVAHLPNMIEIGGFHVYRPNELPQKLKDWLDDAKNGVVYMSMGSIIKASMMPDGFKDTIMNVCRKMKQYRFLWKFEEDFNDKPNNLLIDKWIPQQDVLAHKNIKAFVTHGGLLSTTEAIHYGVPFVGVPLFGDQHMNVFEFERKGVTIRLNLQNITEQSLEWAITEILSNEKYASRTKELSRAFHDRPMKPRDAITYWVEYAERHKGSGHFRSHALDLSLCQVYWLDIFGVIVVSLIIMRIVICKLKRNCCKAKVELKKKKE